MVVQFYFSFYSPIHGDTLTFETDIDWVHQSLPGVGQFVFPPNVSEWHGLKNGAVKFSEADYDSMGYWENIYGSFAVDSVRWILSPSSDDEEPDVMISVKSTENPPRDFMELLGD